jgi:hypothetical protein
MCLAMAPNFHLSVIATIVPAKAEILLGQSFLSRFSSWSIDNEKHALILN